MPPPPDVRNVQDWGIHQDNKPTMHHQSWQNAQLSGVQQPVQVSPLVKKQDDNFQLQVPTQAVKKMEISCANTTLIGDYTSVVFPLSDTRWLVQAQENAMLTSVIALLNDNMLVVDRRYIFIQLGGNQLRSVDRMKIYSQVLDLVVAIRNKNPQSRIYFVGVLPRVIDNQDIKPFIMKFNRWLAMAAHEVNIIFEKVRFLPVQLNFLEGNEPKRHLFQQHNPLLLSESGSVLFKQAVFQLAGFIRNE